MVASVLGMCGNAPGGVQTVAYNTSKAGQINLARALAGEWGRYGIRVNSLLPGWFPTRMSHGTLDEHAGMLQQMPLGRFGTDQDLTGPILFLASDASRYVTGHALNVDGGMLAVM
jgi:gluconate 5-dehydrogenase